MTNYLTEPVLDSLGNVQRDVLIEGLLSAQPSPVADELGWDMLKKLRSVSYGIYVAFEQGRNCPPMALAWRDKPEIDLANYDDVGYELRAAHEPGHRPTPPPAIIARFHDPIDLFTVAMADRVVQEICRIDPAELVVINGNLLNPVALQMDALIEQAGRQIARFLYARIEENMILRPIIYDEDGGDPLGYGQDVAAGLTQAWDDLVARS
jgi:hypothetical protein